MRENRTSGLTSGEWKRDTRQGIQAPATEKGRQQLRPDLNITAPLLDSTSSFLRSSRGGGVLPKYSASLRVGRGVPTAPPQVVQSRRFRAPSDARGAVGTPRPRPGLDTVAPGTRQRRSSPGEGVLPNPPAWFSLSAQSRSGPGHSKCWGWPAAPFRFTPYFTCSL